MVHKNTNLAIVVKENRTETPGYRSLLFERPQKFTFDSGDWIDIEFPGQNLKGGKTYSLSSSPTEPDLMITFKDGVSELKKALAEAKPGDKFTITQYGNDYKFTLNPNRTSTLIAGGVGIAPFRSMIQEMIDVKDRNKVDLVYLNQNPEFLFKYELDTWEHQLPGLKISYIVTKERKKKDRTKAILAAIQTTDQSFYIAGPEGMVESTEHLLLDAGVSLGSIKIDSFGGY
jgi:ferredoxin-NADP reductase